MPFKELMYFMLSMVKKSSQNALERFFPKIAEPHRPAPVSVVREARPPPLLGVVGLGHRGIQ
jgi:hypothetical protein